MMMKSWRRNVSVALRTTGVALCCAVPLAGAVRAQGAINVTDLSGTYGTVGTTAALCVPAATARASLFLYNSGTTTIGYSFGPAPSVGSAGTVALLSGGTGWAFWGPGTAPKPPIYCVSSGAGGQLTIHVGNK